MSESCDYCDMARQRPSSGMYRSGCLECEARAIAHSPAFHASMAAMRFTTEYVRALRALAGGTTAADVEAMHRRVRKWDALIRGTGAA